MPLYGMLNEKLEKGYQKRSESVWKGIVDEICIPWRTGETRERK